MECTQFREALSARLDGEEEPIDPRFVDAHLAQCAGCRQWQQAATAATRQVRLQPLEVPPPVSDRLLDGFPRNRRPLVVTLRVLLGAFGAAQFVLGITQAAQAAAAQTHAGHVFHESAAWNVAIGAGFGWIATRRSTPSGALPMLTAFVALLALLSASDLLAGQVETARLVSHFFVLAGYAIVVALSRPALDPGSPPAGRQGPPWRWGRPPGLDEPEPRPQLRVIRAQFGGRLSATAQLTAGDELNAAGRLGVTGPRRAA